METLRFEIQPLTYVYRKLQLLTVKKAKVVCSVTVNFCAGNGGISLWECV